jgi:glutamate dehydrogenase (NAD(P)+)
VVYATERLLEHDGLLPRDTLQGARIAIQGFGNVGQAAARMFRGKGADILAVSDSSGAIRAEGDQGLDIDAAVTHKREHGTVVGLPGSLSITNEDLLALDCDILVPAALGAQIHADNADRVGARLIVEAANDPVTAQADLILAARGIQVLPDILANAGGVAVSYFEWVQNLQRHSWDEEEVEQRLRTKMRAAVDAVINRNRAICAECAEDDRLGRTLRIGALALAVERVACATLERGIWP